MSDTTSASSAPDKLIELSKVAQRLSRSEETVRRLARSGRIPYYRIGRDYLFDPADVDAFLASAHVRPEPKSL